MDAMSEYIATTRDGWGRSYSEYSAVAKALSHTRPRDKVKVWIYRVDGFRKVWPGDGGILADEVHSEEPLVLSRRDVEHVKDLSTELEIAVEDALVNGTKA